MQKKKRRNSANLAAYGYDCTTSNKMACLTKYERSRFRTLNNAFDHSVYGTWVSHLRIFNEARVEFGCGRGYRDPS
jgi:hypothetical protein